MSPPNPHSVARSAALRPSWAARTRARIHARIGRALARPEADAELSVAGVLDLFEEHFYVGEITAEGATSL